MSRLLPQTMKALVKTDEKESYELKEIPVPQAQEGELLVRILKASICGSDIALYRWNEVAQIIAKVPFTPGHECVAEIVGVGPNCPPEFTVGKRVCCENHYYCGYCYQCSHDQRHICQNLSQYGHGKGTVHGACSQYSIIPARYAYLLKTDIDDNTACLLEPFGVAHQAVEGLFPSGETVLVQGCGPIGLFCIGICKTLKASKIVDVSVAVTHEFPMSQFEKAFEVLFSGQACKIMLNPQA